MSQVGMPNRFHRPPGSGARNTLERILLVVNPAAGAGRAGRRLDHLRAEADRAFEQWELVVTEGPGHAAELALEGARRGFQLVAAVGGDGTAREVADGLLRARAERAGRPIFCLVPVGTGGDLRRSLEVPGSVRRALWIAATGITLPADAGRAEVATDDGTVATHFLNVAGFGAQGEVVAAANRMDKRWGGPLVFLAATLKVGLGARPRTFRLRWDGPDGGGERVVEGISCFVANGARCGGGMRVAGEGSMHDGLLDVTLLPPMSPAAQARHLPRLYDGTIARIPGVLAVRAARLEAAVEGGPPAPVDLDGEPIGRLPARFEVLPRALHVRGGWVRSPIDAAAR